MDRNLYYVAIAFFGIISGLFNQAAVPFAYLFMKILAPALLFGNEPLTLKRVGEEMGVTKERIRQLEARALLKLREAADEAKIDVELGS